MTLDLAHIISIAFNILLFTVLQVERCRAVKREQSLIKAVMADSLTEYHNSPENQIKVMETESKLAERAYKLEHLEGSKSEPGYQVT